MSLLSDTTKPRRKIGRRDCRNVLASLILFFDLSFYVGTLMGLLWTNHLAIKLIFGVLNGFGIAFLILIGHDCGHGTFFSNRRLRDLAGKTCFLFSLTPYSLFQREHNRHHYNTGYGREDNGCPPMSPEAYLAASPMRRMLERIYRSPLGHGIYYGAEVWWKTIFAPQLYGRKLDRRNTADCRTVYIYLLGHCGLLATMSYSSGFLVFFYNTVCGLIVPFLVWTWAFGWLAFVQHSNPENIPTSRLTSPHPEVCLVFTGYPRIERRASSAVRTNL